MFATADLEIKKVIKDLGPVQALQKLLAENDALIRGSNLDIGRRIVSERSAIYTTLVHTWAEQEHKRFGYDRPFAVVALGGTGRGEMAPCSDTDFAFLFNEALEGNTFLLELQNQVLHTDSFAARYGFLCEALPFSIDDVPNLTGKQLNAFLDMRAVYDPDGLTDLFLHRIRASFNSFEHFLYLRQFWQEQWENASLKNEDFDYFDVKNDGLRVFLAGIWTLAGKRFQHSQEIYDSLANPQDLEAYEFLLRIRAFVHLRHTRKRKLNITGSHPEDVMTFDDFISFGEMLGSEASLEDHFEFGNIVRKRLFSARRKIALFTRSVIRKELGEGRPVSKKKSVVYGLGGLFLSTTVQGKNAIEKSSLALSLLIVSQRYHTAVDTIEFQRAFEHAGEWLQITPELSALFYEERGSLADTFEFLSIIEGAEERLFPGYALFESSLDEHVLQQRKSLRGKLQRSKLRALDYFVATGRTLLENTTGSSKVLDAGIETDVSIEAALLDSDHLAAIKLALKTESLPLTKKVKACKEDITNAPHVRYASGFSGVPAEAYYEPYVAQGGFSEQTISLVKFLIENRHLLDDYALAGINDPQLVDELIALCGEEDRIRALFVFICADRVEWGSEKAQPARWFNIRELYFKALKTFRPYLDPAQVLATAGYSQEELAILKDFGQDFLEGVYRRYANRFGSHLIRLALEKDFDKAKVLILHDGASIILGVASRDFRGLATIITRFLWEHNVLLRQAHFFSAMHYGLALDFFHVGTSGQPLPENLIAMLENAINSPRELIQEAESQIFRIHDGTLTLTEWRCQQYCLRYEGTQHSEELIYALIRNIYHYLQADIFGLTAHATRKNVFTSIYLNLPEALSLSEAQAIIEKYF